MENFVLDTIAEIKGKIEVVINETLAENEIRYTDMQELVKDMCWKISPDGVEILIYKNEGLLELHPLECKVENGKMTVTRKFRKLKNRG